MHTVFAYRVEGKMPDVVGKTGSITNAKKIAFDHAMDCGHAAIKHSESVDWTHYRKTGDTTAKVTAV